MDRDDQHLQLLSIFQYVVGGLLALFSLFPLIHMALGVGIMTGALPTDGAEDAGTARLVGGVVALLAGGLVLAGLALAAAMVATGRFLARRTHHVFCLATAGVECVFLPFGTVLGVLTLVVLVRPSVQERFAPTTTVETAPPPPA